MTTGYKPAYYRYVAVKSFFTSSKLIMTAIAFLALVVIPLTIIQVQNSQDIRQRADEGVLWDTNQSATTTCPTNGSGVEISATFSNTEPNKSSLSMDVVVKDQQTGQSVNMGTIKGGETKKSIIQTGKTTLNSGSVTFTLKWTDGHSGVDTRTANYKAVSSCIPKPTPTIPQPTATQTPTGQPTPTPTICPTLGPVKNVKIECPNCP